MKRTNSISSVSTFHKLLQSMLWYNMDYKAYFSKSTTGKPNEYYWYILDIPSSMRRHGIYRVSATEIIVEFLGSQYKVRELEGMRKYDVIIIQFENTKEPSNIMNWECKALPPLDQWKPYSP